MPGQKVCILCSSLQNSEDLLRPHVILPNLDAAYAEMARNV
jgi:hypothetical protein